MVLVTGATGILGRLIVLDLLKRGYAVRASKRPNSNLQDVKDSYRFYTEKPEEYFSKIEWVDVDFDDISSLEKALKNITDVYHTAGKVSFNPDDKNTLYHTNIKGTSQLLYACENSSVKRFCHISSIVVLDGVNEKALVDESCDFNPKLEHSYYAISKNAAEMEVWRASAEALDVLVLNPGVIIGSGNWQQSSGALFSTFAKMPYNFSGGTAYVDVRDVSKCAIELIERQIFGKRFIIVSENKKYIEIGNYIRKKMDLKPLKIISKSVLNFVSLLSLPFSWLFPKLKMINKANVEAVSSFQQISNEKIKQQLSMDFIPVEESIDFHLKNYLADKK